MTDYPYIREATLLIVDDECNVANALRRALRPYVKKVIVANAGETGLVALDEHNIDCVISDMRMPKMDGVTFLTQVLEKYPTVERIILTGYADLSQTVLSINEAKIRYYLTKPWQDETILDCINAALETRQIKLKNKILIKELNTANENLNLSNQTLEAQVKKRTEHLEQANQALVKTKEALKEQNAQIIQLLIQASDRQGQRDNRHIKTIATLCHHLAVKCNQAPLADLVSQAAYFTRLGHIGIKKDWITQPVANLALSVRKQVQALPLQASLLLSAISNMQEIADMVRCYKEKCDGSGYPDGLLADDIPMGAKILSLVYDYFDLQQGYIVDAKLSSSEARHYLFSNKDKYDTLILDKFDDLIRMDTELYQDEVKLTPMGLLEGMCLSRDVLAPSGSVLLTKDTIINELQIQALMKISKTSEQEYIIYVYR